MNRYLCLHLQQLNRSCCCRRYLRLLPSSSSSPKFLSSSSRRFFGSQVNLEKHDRTGPFHLQSLQIEEQCRPQRVRKVESTVKRSFFGELDVDYLHFPKLVESKKEEQFLAKQYDYIRQNFTSIASDQKELLSQGFLFDSTASVTTFELVHFFESVGASLNHVRSSDSGSESFASNSHQKASNQLVPIGNKLVVTDAFLTAYQKQKSFLQAVLPLVLHNALVTRALASTGNTSIREANLSKKGSIAFAFCELNDRLAALPYPFWDSNAVFNEADQSWVISGTKRRIIKRSDSSDYEKYLVFVRTQRPGSSPGSTSTSDNGITAFLVDRAHLQVESDGTDNLGFEYERINFDGLRLSREEHELYVAEEEGEKELPSQDDHLKRAVNWALNIKATGQLAISALIHGMLKEAVVERLMPAYRAGKCPFQESPIFQQGIFRLQANLYRLESALYLTAAHFDAFQTNSVDGLHLQAATVKTLATELASSSVSILRRLFDPRQLPSVLDSQVTDVLAALDGFLDSSTATRMFLGTSGLAAIGRWKYDHIAKMRLMELHFNHLFAFVSRKSFREKQLHRSSAAMEGVRNLPKIVVPELKESAVKLQTALREVMEAGDQILTIGGREAVKNQVDIDRLADSVLACFTMVAVLSRANDTLKKKDGTFASSELKLAQAICREEGAKVSANCTLVFGVEAGASEEKRARSLHKMNVRFGGYFAKPTFDRII